MKRAELYLAKACGLEVRSTRDADLADRDQIWKDDALKAIESAQREAWNEAVDFAAKAAVRLHSRSGMVRGSAVEKAIRSLHRNDDGK